MTQKLESLLNATYWRLVLLALTGLNLFLKAQPIQNLLSQITLLSLWNTFYCIAAIICISSLNVRVSGWSTSGNHYLLSCLTYYFIH